MTRWFPLVVPAVLVVVAVSGCKGTPPIEIPGITGPKMTDEEQILSVLDDVHRGMESRRIFKVLAHVSRSYRDAEGRDYEAIQLYLNTIFKRYRELSITRVRPQIVVQGARARATETFGTIAVPFDTDDRELDLHGQVDVYLEKIGDTWQITEWGSIR